MSTDASGSRPRQTALIREHGGTRTRTLDEHMFTVGATPFRLQLFTAPGLRPVALTTQFHGEGAALVQGATRFAEAIWQRCCPAEQQPPIFIIHQLHESRPAQGFLQLSNPVVALHTLAPPAQRETNLTADEMAQLVGMPIDDSRGDSYVKAEPDEPAERFTVTAVVRLPRPNMARNSRACPQGQSSQGDSSDRFWRVGVAGLYGSSSCVLSGRARIWLVRGRWSTRTGRWWVTSRGRPGSGSRCC